MERLGSTHEALIQECASLDEANDFIRQMFVDDKFPAISYEVLAITGRANRQIGELDVIVERQSESRYIVVIKQMEHYNTI